MLRKEPQGSSPFLIPIAAPCIVGRGVGVAGRLSGTVSPFRAEQGTSLETPWRARASSCQEVGSTWFFSSCGGILELRRLMDRAFEWLFCHGRCVCKASVTLTSLGRPPDLSLEGGLCGCPTSDP